MKTCLICKTSHVKNPKKHWFKGPICYKCYCKRRDSNRSPDEIQKVKEYKHLYYLKNREKCRNNQKDYYESNKHNLLFKNKEYRKKVGRAKERESEKIRIKADPAFKLRRSLSCRIRAALKTGKNGQTTVELTGLTINQLKQYLEARFAPGMEWSNHGDWEIDHICPLSQGKSLDEIRKLCHYTNLQPLWREDNLFKSNNKTPEAENICFKLLNRGWINE